MFTVIGLYLFVLFVTVLVNIFSFVYTVHVCVCVCFTCQQELVCACKLVVCQVLYVLLFGNQLLYRDSRSFQK